MTDDSHQAPPNPFGCRWSGEDRRSHGRRWVKSQGIHIWEQPTQRQILAHMRARRAGRPAAKHDAYHATTGWEASPDSEEGIPYCADCKTDACSQWMRVQNRRDRSRWGIGQPKPGRTGGWAGDQPW